MQRRSRAWILLPAVIVVVAVIGLVVSSFQKEAGIAAPGESGRAAVAAAAEAHQLLSATSGARGYAEFSAALLVAKTAQRNMPLINPADTRLFHLLGSTFECLAAAREAWQAELNGAWDPKTYGRPEYWRAMHASLDVSTRDTLTFAEVVGLCSAQAAELLEKAIDLAE